MFQVDSDGQFLIEEFEPLWSRRADADLVLGVRLSRQDSDTPPRPQPMIARTVSALAEEGSAIRTLPFRLVRRELWHDLQPLIPRDARAPSIMVSLGAARRGWRVVEVPVTHLPRAQGSSTLRSLRLVSFSLGGLRELLAFHHRLRREPARVSTRRHEVA